MSVEEFNHTNEMDRSKIYFLDSISSKLDEEDTLDDDEHDIIDLDGDLPTCFLCTLHSRILLSIVTLSGILLYV